MIETTTASIETTTASRLIADLAVRGCSQYSPQTCRMESFPTIVNKRKPLTIAGKLSVLDVGWDCGYALLSLQCMCIFIETSHKVILIFHLGFLSQIPQFHRTSEEERGPSFFLYTTNTRSHMQIQFRIWNGYLIFLTTVHVITRLLFDEIYPSDSLVNLRKCKKYIVMFSITPRFHCNRNNLHLNDYGTWKLQENFYRIWQNQINKSLW